MSPYEMRLPREVLQEQDRYAEDQGDPDDITDRDSEDPNHDEDNPRWDDENPAGEDHKLLSQERKKPREVKLTTL